MSNILPPKSKSVVAQGYLEIEVSKINLIVGKCCEFLNTPTSVANNNNNINNINNNNNNNNINGKNNNKNYNRRKNNKQRAVRLCLDSVQLAKVKFIWKNSFAETPTGEDSSATASLLVSRSQNETGEFTYRQSREQHKPKKRQRKQTISSLLRMQCNNTLRYNICTSPTLFLEYLRSSEIEIIVETLVGSGNVESDTKYLLGKTKLRLPEELLNKYVSNCIGPSANSDTSCYNFEHKSKIYALFRNKQARQHHHHHHQNQYIDQQERQQKTGEIQLRFKMLFAPNAKHTTAALQDKLTSHLKEQPSVANGVLMNGVYHAAMTATEVDKSVRKLSTKSEEMMKLDAKLVAYLAGEDLITSTPLEQEAEMSLENLNNNNTPSMEHFVVEKLVKESFRAEQLQLFRHITAIKLQMEALTLQPEGTKCMELLQSEVRPIFTVECQLSHELIKNVPRHDMFHIMQFESEKFQSLTQCTRFGQQAQRDVCLSGNADNDDEDKLNFGRIHFAVWWREPGTCLNELLGTGVLNLLDMYNAALMEQCKCIAINRRGKHLASVYFKISLQLPLNSNISHALCNMQALRELFDKTSMKHCNGSDNDADNDNRKNPNNQEQSECSKPQAQTTAGANDAAADSASTQNATNNNAQLDISNFQAETSKVRVLKGFIYVHEMRNLEIISDCDYFLVCRRFWQDDIAATVLCKNNAFNFQEQFAVINDEKFLNRVNKQHLQLEIWSRTRGDGNGNANDTSVQPRGIVRLPLHQFFIAYRDAAITSHLCKGKLPVISVDAWMAITNYGTAVDTVSQGEIKCLLAIGSEEQIDNLKISRGFPTKIPNDSTLSTDNALLEAISLHLHTKCAPANVDKNTKPPLGKTSDLLDMLQNALMQPPRAPPPALQQHAESSTCTNVAGPLLKPLQLSNVKTFKLMLEIISARDLPLNPTAKGKKHSKRGTATATLKRFPPNEAPSTYVTFQAQEGCGKMYKSHEGNVYATEIIEKSTQPQWQQRFRINVNVDYLLNSHKYFILKIWKKSTTNSVSASSAPTSSRGLLEPTPMDDVIIGFASLDFSVFTRGLHIAGWFNIVDFNGRVNGQLEIRCQPLENLQRISASASALLANSPTTSAAAALASAAASTNSNSVDAVIDQFENSLDLTHLNLGQAIKRKFTELEEISQRLRSRLVDVTGVDLPANTNISTFDNWQPLDAALDIDAELEDFERDINMAATDSPSAAPASPTTCTAQNDENNTTNTISTITNTTNNSPNE